LSEQKRIAPVSSESDKTKISGKPSLEREKYAGIFFLFTTPDLLGNTQYTRGFRNTKRGAAV
jgi:hypothetical protein